MLQTVASDVQQFNNSGVRDLHLYRGNADPQKQRRIGWFYGLGDSTYTPGQEYGNGIIDCPKAPCPLTTNEKYVFQITRISEPKAQSSVNPFDRRVFARYSFEVAFPSGGDYTVYFEGCCRQLADGVVAQNGDYLVKNNALWPFHLRAAVTVPTDTVPLYKSSIRWNMPDVTVLRYSSPTTENSACAATICLASSCYRSFTLQAYHQLSGYQIFYRLGTIREMGAYKCFSSSAANTLLAYSNSLCTLTEVEATSAPGLPVRIRGDQFDFDVNREGTWQITVIAYTYVSGKEMGVAVDFLVKVLSPGISNWHSPKLAFPLGTTSTNNVQIQCGEDQWIFNGTTTSFRVYFQNEVNTKPAECIETAQKLRYIAPSTDLPKGVSYTQHVESNLNYIEVTWRPQCEDLSQVGLFQFCFEAEDTVDSTSAATFKALRSTPSCYFVYSRPPLPNPAPVFISPTKYYDCSEGCCECCGLETCTCLGSPCCNREFARAGSFYEFPVHAHDNYLPEVLQVNFDVPNLAPDAYPRDVYAPVQRTDKYSCGASSYDTCTSSYIVGSGRNDVLNVLKWDLTKMYPFKCANSSLQCSGPSDTTCPNAAPCIESSSTNFVGPLKICYQVQEQLRIGVDGALWLQTYGIPPNNNTCKVCFSLAIASSPFFLDSETAISGDQGVGTQPNGRIFTVFLGDTLNIQLLATINNAGQDVTIAMLADPGAPLGSFMTPQETVPRTSPYNNLAYRRYYNYTAQIGQEDTQISICFQAYAGNGMTSLPRCFYIQVYGPSISMSISNVCPPGSACPPISNFANVTIGCEYDLSISAVSPYFPLSIMEEEMPVCDECGASVLPCQAGSSDQCCGNGVCDGVESGSNCPSDCPADNVQFMQTAVGSAANSWKNEAGFAWMPSRGMEGRDILRCFLARPKISGFDPAKLGPNDPSIDLFSKKFCILYSVERCRYCVPQSSTLSTLVLHYDFQIDWRRVYNSNPVLLNPDRLAAGDKFVIGPKYRVRPGDTLVTIAAMAQMTLKSLLSLNADLVYQNQTALPLGHPVCLQLCGA